MSRNNNNGGAPADRRGLGAGADGPSVQQGLDPSVVMQQFLALQQQIQQQAQVQTQLLAQIQAMQQQPRPPTSAAETTRDRDVPSKQEETVAKLLQKQMKGFSGKDRRPHVLVTFLKNFEKYAKFTRLHGEQKAAAFSALLVEDAAIWYQTLERAYEWDEFKREFLHRFRDPQAEQNARVKLHLLKQSTSAKKYTEEFKRLAACISDLTEADRLQTYKHGLKAELRRDAAIRKLVSFDDTVREAEELDEINFQERVRASDDKKPSKKSEKVGRVTEKLRDRKSTPAKSSGSSPSSDDSKAKERQALREKGACFFCKEPGHIQSACPKKLEQKETKN